MVPEFYARNPSGIPTAWIKRHLSFEQVVERVGFDRVPSGIVGMLPAAPQRQPTSGVYAYAHQPSNPERLMPPFTSTFMPLVPLASQGRRGVLIQTSTPCTRCCVHNMS